MKECDAQAENMAAYREFYNKLEGEFDGCELQHIGRGSNSEADALANIGSKCEPIPPDVFYEEINHPSIKLKHSGKEESDAAENSAEGPETETQEAEPMDAEDQVFLVESTWMQPLFDYLTRNELPEDKTEARRVMRRSKAFTIHDGLLHKRSISDVLQRCVVPKEGKRKRILLEIHQGPCGHHVGSRNLVRKAFRAGFYWPTAELDAKEIVKHCEACQIGRASCRERVLRLV